MTDQGPGKDLFVDNFFLIVFMSLGFMIALSLLGIVIIYAFIVLLLLMWNKEKIK